MSNDQPRLLLLVETILDEVEEILPKIKDGETAGQEKKLKRLQSQAFLINSELMDS